jgi:1-aminocyclopropane-1-carboxylate deaminase/D-cysteine desulfhydrase-like pyridoxal-dependent ACC family enzyme
MEVIIGLVALSFVVWYIYKKVGVAADVNNDGKVDSQDAKVAMDMAVSSVGGMATGATVAAASAIEQKVEEIAVKVETEVAAKVEEIKEEIKEVVADVEVKVQELKVGKKGRKPKAK